MRGMIIEVSDRKVIALTSDGQFIEVETPDSNLSIGDDIKLNKRNTSYKPPMFMKVASMAASFLLVCMIGMASYGYSAVFGYVNVDINPSIAIGYNWFRHVVEVTPLNEDGELVMASLSEVNHQTIDDTIEEIVITVRGLGFLTNPSQNDVLISASDRFSVDRSEDILNAIKDILILPDDVDLTLVQGNKNSFKTVKNQGRSPSQDILESHIESHTLNEVIVHSTKSENALYNDVLKPKDEKSNNRDNDNSNKDNDNSNKDNDNSNKDNDNSNKDNDNSNKDKDNSNNGNDNSNNGNDNSNKDKDKNNTNGNNNGSGN